MNGNVRAKTGADLLQTPCAILGIHFNFEALQASQALLALGRAAGVWGAELPSWPSIGPGDGDAKITCTQDSITYPRQGSAKDWLIIDISSRQRARMKGVTGSEFFLVVQPLRCTSLSSDAARN